VNDHVNIAGSGINTAQRVMNFGDSGHILLSKRAADDLAQYGKWQPYLHDFGEWEVKHGAKIGLVNVCTPELGNAELPLRLKQIKAEEAGRTVAARAVFRRKLFTGAGAVMLLAAIGTALYLFFKPAAVPGIPSKSIAVLPFVTLSDDRQDTYLADAMLDEILTDLAKVADLKVISRTSVMGYRAGEPRNLREVAHTLGVAHILEGTVQRVGQHVRVTAQLIDARTDAHIWAERYDKEMHDLSDIFVLESSLAESIVSQLRSRLSPAEKAAIERQPTKDDVAYNYYVRAQSLLIASTYTRGKENRLEAIRLLDMAVERDPTFLRARCELAQVHDELYLLGMDHTPARLALADAALQVALRQKPDAGETHLAFAHHLYAGYFDYDRARAELELAKRTLPNDPAVFELAGFIDRRQGRWTQSARHLKHAVELDPQNADFLQQVSQSYEKLRWFPDAVDALDKALRVLPDDAGLRLHRSAVDLTWRGDTHSLRATLNELLAKDPASGSPLAHESIHLALCERDFAAAERALATMGEEGGSEEAFSFPRAWYQALIARAKGDSGQAELAFANARKEVAKTVQEQPGYGEPLCLLGLIDAGLGDKERAVQEGRRAVELLPLYKDSINGALLIQYLAIIYAWTGDKEHAVEQLTSVTSIPSDTNYGELRLHPYWDPLRGDPRFEKIVAAMAPK
jgi:TolB-like protein/Flp pilus assembly protein TadD